MADNSPLQFKLKITTLELVTKPKIETATTPSTVVDYIANAIDMFDIDNTTIEYRAEGNANIVLALPQMSQVLRLPKHFISAQTICHSTATEYLRAEQIFYVYAYIDSVTPLFGPNLSCRPIFVRIEFQHVNAFNKWLQNHRPQHRIDHNKKDFQFVYGLLYPDASIHLNFKAEQISSTLSYNDNVVFGIEIKPKQGWNICMQSNSLLNLFGIDANGKNKCRFCAMQYLKAKEHSIHGLSKYCPLDLFSGIGHRMENALHNLIASPQNNFRLFINGKLVYTDDNQIEDLRGILNEHFDHKIRSPMDAFVSLLVNILRYDFKSNKRDEIYQATLRGIEQSPKSICIETIPSQLPSNSILNYVLKLQLLAQETVTHVAEMYSIAPSSFVEFVTDENWSHSHIYRFREKLHGFNCNGIDDINYAFLKSQWKMSSEELYEIGATALDASIMLTFQKTKYDGPFNSPVVNVDGQNFFINANVFDLDPKLFPKHFTKYVKKTKESYAAYKEAMQCH